MMTKKHTHTHTHYGLKWEKGRVETSKNIKWSGVTTLCHIATTKMYNVHVVHFILVWLCGFCQSDDCVYGHKETILITTKSTDEINISKIACTLQPHGHTHSWSIYAISIAPITKTHQNACWRSTTIERERAIECRQREGGKNSCEKYNTIVALRIFYFISLLK